MYCDKKLPVEIWCLIDKIIKKDFMFRVETFENVFKKVTRFFSNTLFGVHLFLIYNSETHTKTNEYVYNNGVDSSILGCSQMYFGEWVQNNIE